MSECKTMTVPAAGKLYFDLERDASYRAAQRGDLPIVRIGRTMRVPVIALERMLAEAKPMPAEARD
jgi:hypothetical protein